jgi:hypothetical protein
MAVGVKVQRHVGHAVLCCLQASLTWGHGDKLVDLTAWRNKLEVCASKQNGVQIPLCAQDMLCAWIAIAAGLGRWTINASCQDCA